ncbi:UDP-N-acetylmuramate dehydrogenase [Oscillatoria sp. CS-180]|uniref:UDP-N-acetylmuramate dehydrogenase n=1 Tax=Oscillatoria sp. CS-180 TaxID=3021720 RepID=UPI00232D0B93|nr:UDP-N-acetylmuramate dehydrogenase [Oscillatoria sp. CS-180]MDB9528513.1 UDP-N-acetylmuramate dehydrogenase [Oscillatoria sp. CS-180]
MTQSRSNSAFSLKADGDAEAGAFPLQQQVSLSAFTSYRVGGVADWFSLPKTPIDILASLQWAQQKGLPITLLGAGSNLLISDRGVRGLVICTRHLRGAHFDDATGRLTVAAGEPLPNLASKAARRGWRGMEWAIGIPGTVGGAIFMNAGAHGSCTAETLLEAQGVTLSGEHITLSPEALQFAYRTSSLQSDLRLITEATFQLEPDHDPKQVTTDTQNALEKRRSTQPYHLPSCGSVFRNPPPYTAGWLIEQTGLKAYKIGQAQVSPMHANFIVNVGGATAQDVLRLIRSVQDQVHEQWDVHLHPEVRLLGTFNP